MSALEIPDSIAALSTLCAVNAAAAYNFVDAAQGPCNASSLTREAVGSYRARFDPPLSPDCICFVGSYQCYLPQYNFGGDVEPDGSVLIRFEDATGALVDPDVFTIEYILAVRL